MRFMEANELLKPRTDASDPKITGDRPYGKSGRSTPHTSPQLRYHA